VCVCVRERERERERERARAHESESEGEITSITGAGAGQTEVNGAVRKEKEREKKSPGVEPRKFVNRRLVLTTLPRVRDIISDILHRGRMVKTKRLFTEIPGSTPGDENLQISSERASEGVNEKVRE